MFGNFNFDQNMFIGFLLGFIIGTAIHEFMHAYSALRLGDYTAEREGRVTLNPVAHFDPFGFGMGVLLALGVGGLAWGKPVPVNPYALRFGRRGMSIVAIAGPLSNLALAAVLSPFYRFVTQPGTDAHSILGYMISINILLFCFNLIPVPPLDGFNIITGILPNYWTMVLEPLRRYGVFILLGLVLLLPYLSQIIARYVPGFSLNPVGQALNPVANLIGRLILGGGA